MNKLFKIKREDVNWYDRFYKNEQTDFPSWYVFMLPELIKEIQENSSLLELGCGQAKGLRYLVNNYYIKQKGVFGIDQSSEAIKFSKKSLPRANLEQGNIYSLKYKNNSIDFVIIMEVIEHLEKPLQAMKEAYRVLKPNGMLILSFPNFFNIPWLILRILSEKLNKPNWVVLQPIDKIYTTSYINKLSKQTGFKYKKIIGSTYFPPILYRYENIIITKLLNKLRLNHLSFHPILFFKK